MKKTLFKGALLAFSVMFLATTEVSAQGFFKKLKEAAEKVESVTKTANALMGGDLYGGADLGWTDFGV